MKNKLVILDMLDLYHLLRISCLSWQASDSRPILPEKNPRTSFIINL